jgi:putative ABC transport system ATP-binding protein
MNGERPIIEVTDLCKRFGVGDAEVAALCNLNLDVHAGEFLAIMGPSGSGKSTLLYILGCLSRATSGRYLLDGEDVSQLTKSELADVRSRKLGFIFQSYNLLARTTALRNVTLPLLYNRSRKSERGADEEKAKRLLDTVGLTDRLLHQPHELSGGQQQRVAIARALINDPVMVIADEPTGNLDTHSGNEVMHILQTLHEKGTTIVMVTHSQKIADNATRVIYLEDGQITSIVRNGAHAAQGKST